MCECVRVCEHAYLDRGCVCVSTCFSLLCVFLGSLSLSVSYVNIKCKNLKGHCTLIFTHQYEFPHQHQSAHGNSWKRSAQVLMGQSLTNLTLVMSSSLFGFGHGIF